MVSNSWLSGDSWIIFSSLLSTADWIFSKSFSSDPLISPNKSLKYVLFPQFLINSQCVTASKMDKSIYTSNFFQILYPPNLRKNKSLGSQKTCKKSNSPGEQNARLSSY